MSQYRNRSFIGGGKLFLRQKPSGSTTYPAYPFGNADSFNFTIGEDKKTQRNFQVSGGGNIASQSAITDVTVAINALSMQPNVLAVALRSLVKTVAGGAVADEPIRVFKEGFTPFAKLPDRAMAITIKNTAGTTTYVAGTDYVVERGGITIPAGSTITASDTTNVGVNVTATYTSKETYEVNTLTASGIEYELTFDGFNDADNGKTVQVVCHRVKFSPAQALEFIGEDFGAVPVSLEVLADTSIVAAGESQYFKVKMEA